MAPNAFRTEYVAAMTPESTPTKLSYRNWINIDKEPAISSKQDGVNGILTQTLKISQPRFIWYRTTWVSEWMALTGFGLLRFYHKSLLFCEIISFESDSWVRWARRIEANTTIYYLWLSVWSCNYTKSRVTCDECVHTIAVICYFSICCFIKYKYNILIVFNACVCRSHSWNGNAINVIIHV